MTIEEAIKHCKERAAQDCSDCAKEHQQLAEWLTELTILRDGIESIRSNQQKIYIEKICQRLKDNGCFAYLQEGSQTIDDVEIAFRKAIEEQV